jgi:putative FmdB family regulatory protein
MPTYEYRCAKCGQHIEVFQSFSEAPLSKHQGCGGKLAKVLSPAGIVLKGSGFYKTDSRGGAKKKSAASSEGSDSKSTEKSEGPAKTDSKSSDTSSTSSTSSSSSSSSSDAKSA